VGPQNRVRVKSESGSLHFVLLRSHSQTHSSDLFQEFYNESFHAFIASTSSLKRFDTSDLYETAHSKEDFNSIPNEDLCL